MPLSAMCTLSSSEKVTYREVLLNKEELLCVFFSTEGVEGLIIRVDSHPAVSVADISATVPYI